MAHYFPYDLKLRLLAHSRSFLANQKARNAIVGAENLLKLRWLNRVMQDHEARASDLNRKLIFSYFLLFSESNLLKHNKQGPKFAVQQSPLISRLLVSN